jgi:hypothetical protein
MLLSYRVKLRAALGFGAPGGTQTAPAKCFEQTTQGGGYPQSLKTPALRLFQSLSDILYWANKDPTSGTLYQTGYKPEVRRVMAFML